MIEALLFDSGQISVGLILGPHKVRVEVGWPKLSGRAGIECPICRPPRRTRQVGFLTLFGSSKTASHRLRCLEDMNLRY